MQRRFAQRLAVILLIWVTIFIFRCIVSSGSIVQEDSFSCSVNDKLSDFFTFNMNISNFSKRTIKFFSHFTSLRYLFTEMSLLVVVIQVSFCQSSLCLQRYYPLDQLLKQISFESLREIIFSTMLRRSCFAIFLII